MSRSIKFTCLAVLLVLITSVVIARRAKRMEGLPQPTATTLRSNSPPLAIPDDLEQLRESLPAEPPQSR